MQFFVKLEPKGEIPPLDLGLKVQEIFLSYQKQGKILAGGVPTGQKASYWIFDVDSIEELDSLVRQLPTFGFLECEVIPLTPVEHVMGLLKQMVAASRGSK